MAAKNNQYYMGGSFVSGNNGAMASSQSHTSTSAAIAGRKTFYISDYQKAK
jgi:hypothetical protein